MLRDGIPLEKSHFAEFPFLPQAQQYIARLDIDFAELSTLTPIVERAKQRITASCVWANQEKTSMSKSHHSPLLS